MDDLQGTLILANADRSPTYKSLSVDLKCNVIETHYGHREAVQGAIHTAPGMVQS